MNSIARSGRFLNSPFGLRQTEALTLRFAKIHNKKRSLIAAEKGIQATGREVLEDGLGNRF